MKYIKKQGEFINQRNNIENIASFNSATKGIINKDKTNVGREFIRPTINDTAKNLIRGNRDLDSEKRKPKKISRAQAYLKKIEEKKLTRPHKKPIEKYWRKLEDSASQAGNNVGEKMAGKAGSVFLRVPRYATKNAQKMAVGFGHFARYSAKVLEDIRTGNLEKNEIKLALLRRSKINIKGGGKAFLRSSMRKIENFRGSDDVGIQAIIKPKDALFKAVRTRQRLKSIYKKINPANSLKNMQRKMQKLKQAAKYMYHFAALGIKVLLNAFVLKTMAIILLIILFITLMGAFFSSCNVFNFLFSFTATDETLNETHTYITALDAQLEYAFENIEKDPQWEHKWAHIDEVHKYIQIKPHTNTDEVLAYLTVKLNNFVFERAQSEIDKLHSGLYQITFREWTETVNKIGRDKTIHHLDVTLKGRSFNDYVRIYKTALFTDDDEYERFVELLDFGGTTFRKELGSPFLKQDWKKHVSSRFGYRIDPFSKEVEMHFGIDIAMPNGTPINAVMGGKVSEVGNDPEGYGNYVIVQNGSREILYAHCSEILVEKNGSVSRGDIIAKVGSTGTSTGDHLHLEYLKDFKAFNPMFFLKEK